MRTIPKTGRQAGFTLVELVIAMAIFSAALLIVAIGFINVIKSYQAGLAARNAQQNARFSMEQIVREAREASRAIIPAAGVLCLVAPNGTVQYYVNAQRLYRASIDPTQTCNAGLLNPTAITSADVAVVRFNVTSVLVSATAPWNLMLDIGVSSTGDLTRLVGPEYRSCNPAVSGANFCSVMNLKSGVTLRGKP